MKNDKIKYLLDLVVENYIDKGEPIGSKFLHTLEETDYAPSTLRKYLNILEQEGLLYQPYNSAGRVPTIKGLSSYLDEVMDEKEGDTTGLTPLEIDIDRARSSLRYITENLGNNVDGTVVGFLKDDEYYYLGINNLLKNSMSSELDYDTVKHIVKYIEDKKIINFLNKRIIKRNTIYYDFIEKEEKVISAIYSKIDIAGYDGVISIIGPMRVNYKRNISILKQFFNLYNSKS